MKICILGNARSGTTAIYTLLQNILKDHYERVSYAYEPFLWDKQTFNDRFERVTDRFQWLDSTSVEGMYQHQRLPMFIRPDNPLSPNGYLEEVLEHGTTIPVLLAKFIRANGRIRLLDHVCPGMKYIFILRNPLDSVHSVLTKFSFFGGEFHHDDYPRFIKELEEQGFHLTPEKMGTPVARELAYWYHMNLFALRTLSDAGVDFMAISHERYTSAPHGVIDEICRFLGLPFSEEYVSGSGSKVGDLTANQEISSDELEVILPYLEDYPAFLSGFGIPAEADPARIAGRYRVVPAGGFRSNRFYGKIPLLPMYRSQHLEGVVTEKNRIIAADRKLIAELQEKLSYAELKIQSLTRAGESTPATGLSPDAAG